MHTCFIYIYIVDYKINKILYLCRYIYVDDRIYTHT